MFVLSCSGFLRYNELSQIKLEHISFTHNSVNIFIPSSKTDVYQDGRNVLISASDSDACPIKILKMYIPGAKFALS